jgi:glutathione S-transferase
MALKFYHVGWCPECAVVRDKLEELHVSYEDVVVPDIRQFRKQVHEVSGQSYVPVIQDGDLVLTETRDILAYLDEAYGAGGAGTAATGKWRAKTPKPDRTQASQGEGDDYPSCRL